MENIMNYGSKMMKLLKTFFYILKIKVKTTTENPELTSEFEELFMNLTNNVENIGTPSTIYDMVTLGDTQISDMNETNSSSSSSSSNTISSSDNSSSSSNDSSGKIWISTEVDIIMEPPYWEPVDSIIITNCTHAKDFSIELYDEKFHHHDDVNTFFLLASLSQQATFSLAEDILNIFKRYFSLDKCQLEIIMMIKYMGVIDNSVSKSVVKYVIYFNGIGLKITEESEMVITEKLTNYPIKLNYPKTTVNLKEIQSTTSLPTSLHPQGQNQGLPRSLIIILCAIFTIIILPISVIFFLCQRRKGHYNMKHATTSSEEQEVDLNDEESRSCEGNVIELKNLNETYHIVPY